MRFKNSINKVIRFFFIHDKLLTSNQNEVFIEQKSLINNVDGASIYKLSDDMILVCSSDSYYYLLQNEIVKSNFRIFNNDNTLIGESKPIRIEKGKYKRNLFLINEDLNSIVKPLVDSIIEYLICHNKEVFFLFNGNSEISTFEISTSNLKWTFNLSQLPSISSKEFANPNAPWEIKKIIGVLDNKLWVAMNHRTIIALSIETGDLVHIISEIPNFEMEWIHNSIPSPEATQIIENENILLGFVDAFVWKINAETGEISIKDYTPYFKENRIMNYRNEFIIDKELLFFLSDTDSKVGCFNRNTEQLEWQHSFDKDETGYAPRLVEIQGNRNKLGVKDLNNTLYIFENVN